MHDHRPSIPPTRVPPTARGLFTSVLFLLVLVFPCVCLLCGCHVWKAYKGMKDVRQDIAGELGEDIAPYSRYHLEVAEGLLEAAEKQYEDADFPSATEFARQAADHLDRSRQLRAFREQVIREIEEIAETGDPAGGPPW